MRAFWLFVEAFRSTKNSIDVTVFCTATSSLALTCAQDYEGVLITLQDIDTGLVYTTRLSPKDARRVETVLSALKRNEGSSEEQSSSSSIASMASTLNVPESEDSIYFKWSHQAFNGMKRTFKSIRDHNSKSGNSPRSWPYTEVMESLLGEKPFMNPVTLPSLSNQAQIENENNDMSSSNSDTSVSSSNFRKRKTSQIAEVIMKSRRLAEENKLKRHQPIMDQQNQILKALNKLIDKLQ
ncbi:hypothetical protein ACFW04_013866 [Cataglyphis niger]